MAITKITLINTNRKAAAFEYFQRKSDGKIVSRPAGRDRGFSQGITEEAQLTFSIEGQNHYRYLSGDAWRFFEGTLGIEVLNKGIRSAKSLQLLDHFLDRFESSHNDDEANTLWGECFEDVLTDAERFEAAIHSKMTLCEIHDIATNLSGILSETGNEEYDSFYFQNDGSAASVNRTTLKVD